MRIVLFCLLLFTASHGYSQLTCSNWLKLNGAPDGVRIGDLDITGNKVTVEAVFNRSVAYSPSYAYAGDIVSKHVDPTDCNYLLRPRHAEITTTNGFFATAPACDFQLNKTYHVAMVYDGATLKFYRNGFLMNQVNATGNLITNNWITKIGETAGLPFFTSTTSLVGFINEVRIWNVARTQQDIKTYMNASLPNPTTQTGLAAYYTFDNLINKQGNAAWNGTINGTSTINSTNPSCTLMTDSCNVNVASSQLCTGSLGDPVVNITFGSGANPGAPLSTIIPGASTSYTYVAVTGNPATPIVYDGEYTITNNVISHPAWFSGALDHTPGDVNGYMAFFNAADAPGEFYKQTITGLCENTRYEFAAWIANVLNPAALVGVKPDITFVIQKTDGTQIASFASGPVSQRTAMTWEQYGFYFATPVGVNSVVLKMINTNPGGTTTPGNDLAIDDITFRPCGPLLTSSFSSSASQLTKTQCGFNAVPLFGNVSTGYTSPSYLWQISLNNGATWSDISSSNTINYTYTPTTSGTFLFRVLAGESTNINSPSCRVASNSITLIINPPPQLSISGNTVCPGKQGQLQFQITGGTSPYSIVVNNGTTNITLANTLNGIPVNITPNPGTTTVYNVVSITDAVGCMRTSGFTISSASITVLSPTNAACVSNVQVSFTTPDTVCVNTPVAITNTSIGASTYYWNFCVADLNTAPTGTNLGNVGNNFSTPVFIDYALYNGNYYGFVTNYTPGKLTRLDFGNSLLNTPTSVDLGNFGGVIPSNIGTEGIQIVFNENRWYAIIVGGYTPSGSVPRIAKLDFGANLTNTNPIATNWGNIGNMLQPLDLHVFKEGINWFGLTVNAENNSITRFNFTNSFNNVPTAVNLGNLGNLEYPVGIYAINDNNFWRVFIVNAGDNNRVGTLSSLTRLDFGSSLLNTPTAVNLGNPGGMLKHPRDLTIMKSCDQIIGFAVNGNPNANDIVKLNFNNNLSATPTITSLGNIGNLNFPHSISRLFRVKEDIYGFVTNAANNTITRLKFSGCPNASLPSSTLQNPGSVTYNTPGSYNINLTIDDGLATQDAYCKRVVVVAGPAHKPTQNLAFCAGENIRIGATPGMAPYLWSNGATTDSISISGAGIYWVETSRFGCSNRDSFSVSLKPKANLTLPTDTSICKGTSLTLPLQTGAGFTYNWFPAAGLSDPTVVNPSVMIDSSITYSVTATATGNSTCPTTQSIIITALPKPNVITNPDTSICGISNVQLQTTGAQGYVWSPATGLNNNAIADPVASINATTTYIVVGTGANGCKASDTVTITLLQKPVIAVSKDTTVCQNKNVPLIASGAQQYLWSPATGLSAANIANPLAIINTSITYTVIGKAANGCSDTKSVIIGMLAKPVVSLSADTIMCAGAKANLQVSGGQQYLWSPANSLNDPASATPIASPTTTTKYYVTSKGSNGCDALDSVTVSVKPAPVFGVTPINPSICGAGSVQLFAKGGDSYLWQPATFLSNPNIANPVASPNASTAYSVTVRDTVCRIDSVLKVTVVLSPDPVLVLSKDGDITCGHPFAQLQASGAATYKWTPAIGLNNAQIANPIATVNASTTFYVEGISDKGCKTKDSIQIKFLNTGDLSALQLPSAFTPNGDGKNDCFGLKKWGNVEVVRFDIFNRWGEIVFKGKSAGDCWDGTFRGLPQDTGAFIYIVKVKTACGDVDRKGTIVLIR